MAAFGDLSPPSSLRQTALQSVKLGEPQHGQQPPKEPGLVFS